ncbi:hypothetical protein C0993_010721 [Termitomyces sp. T159_Od127]|nr:hypothetical protein C0993_010721 [Termitomyces sp. T159_Od127]
MSQGGGHSQNGLHPGGFGGMEGTLLWFGMQVILPESSKDAADMIVIFLQQVQVDQDVVQVHNDKDIIYVVEDAVHEVLEGGRGVDHSKGHHEILEEAIAGAEEGGFPFMSQGYVDIVVAKAEVNLSIYFSTAEAVNKVTDEEEGIPVCLGDFVKAPVVDTKA